MPSRTYRPRQCGFTLIELAIVITIVGFFMVGLVKAYELYQADKIQRELDNKMDEMRAALARYIKDEKCVLPPNNPENPTSEPMEAEDAVCADHQNLAHMANEGVEGDNDYDGDLTPGPNNDGTDAVRYPCPANPALSPDESGYASEDCSAGWSNSGTFDPSDKDPDGDGVWEGVIIGAFPASTLDLSSEAMIDPYGNKYSYAVSAALVQQNALNTNPQPQVKIKTANCTGSWNGSDPDCISSRFVLFSHGRTGAGAYSAKGTRISPDSGTMDFENANNDDVFVHRRGYFQARGGSFYDDKLAFSLVDDTDDEWWHSTGDAARHITHRNPGNIGIGTASPSSKLQVDGDIQIGNQGRSNAECDSTTEGAQRYNKAEKGMEYCDGADWKPLGGSVPIGGYVTVQTNLGGAEKPDRDKYIQLTAGLSGSGQYNDGQLTNENVSGSQPTLTATAKISDPDSPLDGQTVHLINTEERHLQPGESPGTTAKDQLQNLTGRVRGNDADNTVFDAATGVFSTHSYRSDTGSTGTGEAGHVYLNFDASNVARTGDHTDVKNIQATYFMRIK